MLKAGVESAGFEIVIRGMLEEVSTLGGRTTEYPLSCGADIVNDVDVESRRKMMLRSTFCFLFHLFSKTGEPYVARCPSQEHAPAPLPYFPTISH